MTLVRLGIALAAGALFSIPATAVSQTADSAKTRVASGDARDTLFLRARRLVTEGNGAAGRALVDSALAATEAGSTEYATALYWRGALSSTAADAERDYRRVIVDYPFSPHSGDALLALAQLEMARGDRDPAIDHLQRFLLQRPDDPDRVRAGIWLGRMLLEQNQPARGCAVLLRTRASLGDTAVETRNQVDYYAARCAGVDTVVRAAPAAPVSGARPPRAESTTAVHRPPPRRDSTRPDTAHRQPPPRRDSARGDSATRPRRQPTATDSVRPKRSTPNATTAAAGRFTVQVAAYDTRHAAEELVVRLGARGIVARLVPSTAAPYRVRVGRYATDEAATAAARELKDKGIVGFVTTTDNESAPSTVRR